MTVNMDGGHDTSAFSIACTESKQQSLPAAGRLCLPDTHSNHCTASTYIDVTCIDLVVQYIYICAYTDN